MISIIIPTHNEEKNIGRLISFLQKSKNTPEIIVCDGGSNDKTLDIAAELGVIAITAPVKGRSGQMNYGASLSRGEILFFIHADSLPPTSFDADIAEAVKKGYEFGRYRTKFDSKKWLLKLNAFFTRFDFFECYGGDQTFFIKKDFFNEIGGFNEGLIIMEDYEMTQRAKEKGRYKIFNKPAMVSARKYEKRGWLSVQKANYKAIKMYQKGASQNEIADSYKKMLD